MFVLEGRVDADLLLDAVELLLLVVFVMVGEVHLRGEEGSDGSLQSLDLQAVGNKVHLLEVMVGEAREDLGHLLADGFGGA